MEHELLAWYGMDYLTFSKALPELLLAATQVLRRVEGYLPDDACERTGFIESRDRVARKLEEVQEKYNEGVSDLDSGLFADLSEIDEQLSFVLHFARSQTNYRTFLFYKNYQCTLHFEVSRALGRGGPVGVL